MKKAETTTLTNSPTNNSDEKMVESIVNVIEAILGIVIIQAVKGGILLYEEAKQEIEEERKNRYN